ncbi:uncharacterized protein LOC124934535 [Impatiens glandulifera]|uniref:uncharacterized protein LOC124934535 n=1 Tax=Impatiens glandulifera TaxID=253017 RepID=UPI001FB15C29|nr:uncharacterized protein LOC124934535 [Impatiens glandulifera]
MVGFLIPSKSKVSNATIPSTAAGGISGGETDGSSSRNRGDCCGLSNLVTNLLNSMKKRSSEIRMKNRSRQSSFKCRYDPSSYSLNFDSSGNNNLSFDDDYYYRFCTFSSRFACAVPITAVSPPPSAAFSR